MTNYLYDARVFPIGKPASVRGDRGQPVTFTFDKHDFSVSRRLASDIPVCLKHDPDLKIGNLRSLAPNRDWWVCCFGLDEDLGIEFDVGQNVSVGLEWRLDDPGAPRLGELSIVRHGRVPGAEIMHRIQASQPASTRAANSTIARARGATKPYEVKRYKQGHDLVIEMSDGTAVIHSDGQTIRRNIGQVLALTDEYGCRTEFEH